MAKDNKMDVTHIDFSKIIPQPDQPRTSFDPLKLHTLAESIKAHGLKQPLDVRPLDDGKFMVIDGERRYRALKSLKHSGTVPCIVENVSDEEAMLIQFHLQEQHENWTPTEKALAIINIAKKLKITISQVSAKIGMSAKQASVYAALASLTGKNEFVKSELPIGHALQIKAIKNAASRIYSQSFNEEFTQEKSDKLENSLIEMCVSGQIKDRVADFCKIKDAMYAKPETINTIIKGTKETADGLFHKSKAQSQKLIRNLSYAADQIANTGKLWIANPTAWPTERQVESLKKAEKVLKEAIDKYEHEMAD